MRDVIVVVIVVKIAGVHVDRLHVGVVARCAVDIEEVIVDQEDAVDHHHVDQDGEDAEEVHADQGRRATDLNDANQHHVKVVQVANRVRVIGQEDQVIVETGGDVVVQLHADQDVDVTRLLHVLHDVDEVIAEVIRDVVNQRRVAANDITEVHVEQNQDIVEMNTDIAVINMNVVVNKENVVEVQKDVEVLHQNDV